MEKIDWKTITTDEFKHLIENGADTAGVWNNSACMNVENLSTLAETERKHRG